MSSARTANFIASAALIVSTLSLGWQVIVWLQGAEIRTIEPDAIVLYGDQFSDGKRVIRVGSPMSFINTGGQNYSDVLKSEVAHLTIGEHRSRQPWNSYGRLQLKDRRLGIVAEARTLPQAVPGQTAISHFTLFAPLVQEALSPEVLASSKVGTDVTVVFESQFLESGRRTSECAFRLTREVLEQWAKRGNMYQRCLRRLDA